MCSEKGKTFKQGSKFLFDFCRYTGASLWDKGNFRWWFCVVDIAEALTKSRNPCIYWAQSRCRNSQLITICKQQKLNAYGGKMYITDMLMMGGGIP